MPYKVKGNCVYLKNTGAKVGCTQGSIDKYLAALNANVDKSINERMDSKQVIKKLLRENMLNNNNIDKVVLDFLKRYKDGNIPDKDVHDLSNKLGVETDKVESIFYKFAAMYANSKEPVNKIKTDGVDNQNPTDIISMDVPFLIRVMEYSKEDAKTDMDLHKATEKMIALSKNGKSLTMDDYDSIFGKGKIEEGLGKTLATAALGGALAFGSMNTAKAQSPFQKIKDKVTQTVGQVTNKKR